MKVHIPHRPALLLLAVISAALLSLLQSATGQALKQGKLAVDFTNDESRSISVRLGSDDGITADLNFAVLDSAGVQIAEFFPVEILTERFWSGPLAREDYARVKLGSPVVRIELERGEALRLRDLYRERTILLKEERRLKMLASYREDVRELEEMINEVDVRSVRVRNGLESLQEKLGRENDLNRNRIKEIQDQIDELREERSDLLVERDEIVDDRDRLARRNDPPQDRLSEMNTAIGDLDREIALYNARIDDLRRERIDLGEDARELQEEIREVRNELRNLQDEKRELGTEIDGIRRKMEELKKRKL